MKLYLIGGLGADKRVFDYLDLKLESTVVEWIDPNPNEDISQYALRLLGQIDRSQAFGLVGVSFGGLIAIEISKLSSPQKVILISSVASNDQLPKMYINIGKLGLLALVPNAIIKPPKIIQKYMFGAKNESLLNRIIADTDPKFIRWALNEIIHWKHDSSFSNVLRIHGTKDRLIPLNGDSVKIQNGGHFMIVDKAKEISRVINDYLDMNCMK